MSMSGDGMNGAGSVATRLLWFVTGIAWAATSLLSFAQPQYWDPVTTLDWTAVWAYTTAWLLFAPSVVLLGRLSASPRILVFACISAIGAIVAGVSNALEDAFSMETFGTWYIVGLLVAGMSLLPLAFAQRRMGHTRLAGLSLALFFGIMLFTDGGGFIILGGLGAIAIAPGWFTRSSSQTASRRRSEI